MYLGRLRRQVPCVSWLSLPRSTQRASSDQRIVPFAIYQLPSTKQPREPRRLRKPWAEASVAELEQKLAWTARNEPSVEAAESLLRYMLLERDVRPTTAHYEALILANTEPSGSVSHVKALLSEIQDLGLPKSSLIENAVLEVLAVHPDPALRDATIQKLQREWIELSATASHANVAALIREGQLELAQKEIHQIESGGRDIPAWLYTLMAHTMAQAGDFESVMGLIHRLHDNGIELPRNTWLHLLDASAELGHLPVADWIWFKHVEPMFITPDLHCCEKLLQEAAKQRNLQLAEGVLRLLTNIDPATAKRSAAVVDAAYKSVGRVRTSQRPSNSMHTMFGAQGSKSDAFFDPKEALMKQPLQRFLSPGYQRRRETFKASLSRGDKAGDEETSQ